MIYELKENDIVIINNYKFKFIKCDGMYGKFIKLDEPDKGKYIFLPCGLELNELKDIKW
jgi:hypothetical protein